MSITKNVDMGLEQDQIVRLLFMHRAKILGYIWSIVRDFDLAEDMFQDMSVLALKKASTIQDEQHFHRWVRASARLISLATMRRLGHLPLPMDAALLDQLDSAWAVSETDQADEGLEALDRCLKKLSQRARRIVELRYRGGLVGGALAEAMEQSVNTVYVALSRTHRFLRDCVRQQLRQIEE